MITIGAQTLTFALKISSTAVLARILSPGDFGLIALATVATGVIEIFKDAGLSQATIQRPEITHAQVSTLFWINVGLSVLLMIVKGALAPVIVWIYGDSRLLEIILALAALSIFGGLAVQHKALLQRRMQFGKLAAIEVISMIIGIAAGILLAWDGAGYWSLVGMAAGTAISAAGLSFVMSGWFPGLPSRGSGVRPMLRFGGNLTGANFFNYLTRNSDSFIIGFVQGSASLGVYNKAYSLFLMPLQQFLGPVSRVVVPALSRLKDDPAKFRSMVIEKSYFVAFFVLLSTGLSFAAAPELVRLILGPGWTEASTIVRCLAVGGAIYGTNIAGGWVNTAAGKTGRQFRLALVAGPIYTVSFVIGANLYGAVGVACAFSATCLALRYPAFKYLLRDSPVRPKDLILPLVKVGVPVACAAVAAMGIALLLNTDNIWASLAVKVGVFSGLIGIFCVSRSLRLPLISLKPSS